MYTYSLDSYLIFSFFFSLQVKKHKKEVENIKIENEFAIGRNFLSYHQDVDDEKQYKVPHLIKRIHQVIVIMRALKLQLNRNNCKKEEKENYKENCCDQIC